jgi:hypothetical protein
VGEPVQIFKRTVFKRTTYSALNCIGLFFGGNLRVPVFFPPKIYVFWYFFPAKIYGFRHFSGKNVRVPVFFPAKIYGFRDFLPAD